MYVCICHAFTDRQVERALDEGVRSAAGVYKALGCTPQCGKCVSHVREMVRGRHARHARAAMGVVAETGAAGEALLIAAE